MKKYIPEIIGWYGTIAILGAYALLSLNLLSLHSFLYQFLNLTGAIGIGTISLVKKAYQPVAINFIWAAIAAIAIIKIFFR